MAPREQQCRNRSGNVLSGLYVVGNSGAPCAQGGATMRQRLPQPNGGTGFLPLFFIGREFCRGGRELGRSQVGWAQKEEILVDPGARGLFFLFFSPTASSFFPCSFLEFWGYRLVPDPDAFRGGVVILLPKPQFPIPGFL